MKFLLNAKIHWQTSSLGVIAGLLNHAATQKTWQEALLSIAIGVLGLVAKDANK